jgi:hypothetical protein
LLVAVSDFNHGVDQISFTDQTQRCLEELPLESRLTHVSRFSVSIPKNNLALLSLYRELLVEPVQYFSIEQRAILHLAVISCAL